MMNNNQIPDKEICGPNANFSKVSLFLNKYQIIPDSEETNKINGKLQIVKNNERFDNKITSPQPKESFFKIKSPKYLTKNNKPKHIKKEDKLKTKLELKKASKQPFKKSNKFNDRGILKKLSSMREIKIKVETKIQFIR